MTLSALHFSTLLRETPVSVAISSEFMPESRMATTSSFSSFLQRKVQLSEL